MDLFLAIHRWDEKDQREVLEEAMKVFVAADKGKYKGAKLVGTYSAYLEKPISWCVWEADNEEVLHNILDNIPKVETEIIPVVQLYKTAH